MVQGDGSTVPLFYNTGMMYNMDMDRLKFIKARETVMNSEHGKDNSEPKQIGTLGERTLHAVIKHYIEPDDRKHEVKIGSFYADIVRGGSIVEIQTRAFYALRKKLSHFLKNFPVTIVYPLANTKWLLWINEKTGEVTKRRKSPRQGSIYDAAHELYGIKPLLGHSNLSLQLVFVDVEEYRYLDGWSKNKKRGLSRCDRHPSDIIEEAWLRSPADYMQFIPDDLPEQFTTKDLKQSAKIHLSTAQTTLNILHHLGTVRRVGKQGNLYIYERG